MKLIFAMVTGILINLGLEYSYMPLIGGSIISAFATLDFILRDIVKENR